jgi:hypothetical protein
MEESQLFNRREFLITSAAVLAGTALGTAARGDGASIAASATVSFDPSKPIGRVPSNFAGLSYESAQLGNASVFSPSNKTLVSFFQTLAPSGVLRIGGNSSEFCDWGPDISSLPPPAASTGGAAATGADQKPHKRTIIQPDSITNLAGFLNATGWTLIYGLNLGTGTPQEAADEAAAVAKAIGTNLAAFQIGNEPDLYGHNGLRPTGWDFANYLTDWNSFAAAIRQAVPAAVFGAPDVASNVSWIESFAALGKSGAGILTGHYYAGGPPTNPAMDIPHLLGGSASLDKGLPRVKAAAQAANLPFRLSETNSCWGGGKPGVSDTFASALWAASLMLRFAAAGSAGVNFHGGGSGHYTPIAGNVQMGYAARPIFYGMMLASQLASTTLIAGTQSAGSGTVNPNLDAYAGVLKGETRVALINRDLNIPTRVAVQTGSSAASATIWRLTAPAVDSTRGVRLAGSEVGNDGAWSASAVEQVPVLSGTFTVDMPAASALVAFVK